MAAITHPSLRLGNVPEIMSTTQRMTNLQNGLKGSLCEITRTLSSAEQFVDEAGMLLAKQFSEVAREDLT
eukprot:CAMPEP_0173107140 /NCGR_PEP_ID=MMETSP1102-20130122/41570_1 /TAXON_ID=49646 /ORGANISM="Geminigera sp., Strain Caron Lab Isolate" /LENGTH=69 /DNA_ID=CAMNT_0014004613 /DNA_START=74 /DNA_END=280 /DNA_ORIENTATION=-